MDQTVMQKLSDGAAELPENKRRYGYGRGWVGKIEPAGSGRPGCGKIFLKNLRDYAIIGAGKPPGISKKF